VDEGVNGGSSSSHRIWWGFLPRDGAGESTGAHFPRRGR